MPQKKAGSSNHYAAAQPQHLSDYLRLSNLLIPQKLGLIIAIFTLIICGLLLVSSFGMGILSDVRAYVAGEGLWSKAQKQVVYDLTRYAIYHQDVDYQKYLSNLQIPLGDRKALIELEKHDTDYKKLDAAFVEGQNHPSDVRGMGYLIKRFFFISYIRDALIAWKKADRLLDELIDLGESIRREVLSNSPSDQDTAQFLARLDEINNQLTPLENLFSYRLGEGARWLRYVLTCLMLGATGLLLLLGILVAISIARHLISEIHRLRQAAAKIAAGDFSQPIDITSWDEVGDLARSFQQMADQRERAEKMLGERANELSAANQKLVETEKMKDAFLATVSHELRTPLTLVLTPLESLLIGNGGGNVSDDQRRVLEIMHNNAIRLLQMVTGLLDFSKLGAGQMEVHREPTDLAVVTRSILADFGAMLSQKQLSSGLTIHPPEMDVLMDRYLYERILFNLLSNAVKFTPQGGRIDVALTWQNDHLSLSVADTGIGISEENQKYLFEKFKQLEETSTRRFEGTGLGLALVKEFAVLLGGSVAVVSRAGAGTTFTVDCAAPAIKGHEVRAMALSSRRRLLQQYPMNSRGTAIPKTEAKKSGLPKLLIAEDNPELAAYVAAQIQDIAEVKIARDGEEALALARDWSPNLVLSDVMMPKLDGLSLCRAIKADSNLAHIPVILLTALTHREALLKGWEAGADEYLMKPFHPTELLTRVKSVLAGSHERQKTLSILQESRHQLELRVLERTAELLESNKSLIQQKRDLEKVNLELDSFVYTASHDLRAPLRAIASFAEVLREKHDGQLDEQGRTYLSRIESGAVRMGKLIDDLMSVSRLTRIQNPYESVSVKGLLDSVVQRLDLDVEESHVRIEIQPEIPAIVCDRIKMAEVFLNLISNAIKFSRIKNAPQGFKIEIGYHGRETDHEFYVKDEGIGIDQRYHHRMFDIFWQLDPSHAMKGTGVGLSIVKRVIEEHGGRVWVESKIGEGATFYFTIPRKPAQSRT
ncbi:MAG: hypothetical protein A2Y02_02795 [Omnitrophica bacterium GWA2_52_12]|nr:MAG: hypothetical protein A2Y02_02795 [Omnitrophica bacterium GWA2_52_12]